MQEALYSSPEATSELLRTARIDPLLRRLKPELDSLWAFNRDVIGQDERSRLRLHMEFDYVRLYSNAISIRSAQYRLLRRFIVSLNCASAAICAPGSLGSERELILCRPRGTVQLYSSSVSCNRPRRR